MAPPSASSSGIEEKNEMGAEEQQPTRHPTFERHTPTRNNSTPAKTLLSRQSSIQSTAITATSLWRRFRSKRKTSPIHPSLKRVEREEGAPVPRGEPVKCSFDEVFSLILPQANSPEFDGLDSYILVKSVHERLWRMEAERLLEVVKNPENPLQFSNDKLFKQADEEGYRELSTSCQKILTAISICLLDDECITSEYCSKLSNKAKLSKLIRMATLRQNTSDHEAHSNRKADEISLDSIFCLVNYISAVFARLVTQTSPGHYWQCNVLSVLVKRVTKIKVLLCDLHAYSAVAVRAGEAALERVAESGLVPDSVLDEEEECEEIYRMIEANEKAGFVSLEEKEAAAHCVEQTKFRSGINDSFRFILMSMRFTNRSGLPATTFELCGVVYETGFEGFKVSYSNQGYIYSTTAYLTYTL